MQVKNSEKKQDWGELEKVISPILVVDQIKLKPFIELFESYPENINSKPLGTMVGFFKINDQSEDSAYIVNFLSSVIKKEYYINPKRSVSESFDAALHKTNLALAEIAKNGNIRWIGQLDAAICVLEKNILHFTVCGASQILLLRNQMLSDISHDLNPEELEPNPIKTFSNVSSGYLEKDDKVIITSGEIFNLFSLNELKKGSLRFDQEKFAQFLKTAMINELDSAATIIVDVNENAQKQEKRKAKIREALPEINPFDGKTFENPVTSPQFAASLAPNSNETEYTDEKTGHIYVQGDSREPQEANFWGNFGIFLKEKLIDFSYWFKSKMRKVRLALKQLALWLKKQLIALKIILVKKIREQKKKPAKVKELKIPAATIAPIAAEISTPVAENKPAARLEWKNKLRAILPAFSRIKKSFTSLNYQQRVYALLALIVIMVIPILFLKWRSDPAAVSDEPVAKLSTRDVLLRDQSIREVSVVQPTISSAELKNVIFMNDQLFIINPQEIMALKADGTSDNFALPPDFDSLSFAVPMEDLNLIFLLSDSRRLISFSPISKKFQENNLVLPANSKVEGVGTYLTYFYAVDSDANQIYRYPRATGGFGNKVDWLKDALDLKNLSDIAIEENIYLAQNNQIIKLFQGKNQAFNLTPASTPLSINKIFTGRNVSSLYVLDSQSGRVARFSKDGALLNQYYNAALEGALSFSVDEKNNKVFFVTAKGLSSFEM